MSVLFMLGGENALIKSDFVASGLIQNNNPASSTGGQAFTGPSINGLPGRSIRLAKPFNSQGFQPLTSANGPDFGMYQLPKTIKQLWDAGGFAVSGRLKFNSQNATTIGAQMPNLTQAVVDPSTDRIYAIRSINSTYNLYTSTDLGATWSTVTLPGGYSAGSLPNTTLSLANGYLCMSVHGVAAVVYSTNDNGTTWQTLTISAGGIGNTGGYGVVYTADPTYPYIMTVAGNGTSTTGIVALSSLAPSAVQVGVGNLAGSSYSPMSRLIAGYVVSTYSDGRIIWGNTAADLSNAANWVSRSNINLGLTGVSYGVEFANNQWFISGSSDGVKYMPNPGTLPAVLPPAIGTATAVTLRGDSVAAAGMYGMARIGTELFAVGPTAYTAYSADNGVTWTYETGTRVLTLQGQNYNWCVASTTRFFIATDSNAGILATSLHAGYGWEVKSVSEGGESNAQPAVGFGIYGAVSIAANNVVTYQSGNPELALYASAPTGNARNVGVAINSSGGIPSFQYTVTDAQTNQTRHWELVCTADPATINSFFVSVRLDGNIVLGPTTTSYPLAGTGVTGGIALLNIPSNGTWTWFDDIAVVDFSGSINNSPLGVSAIVPVIEASDAQAQWDRVGGAASNALTVAYPAPSAVPTAAYATGRYVETADVGDKDIYVAAVTVDPGTVAGYNPRAIQVDGFFTRQGSGAPQVRTGAIVGATTYQGTATSISGSNRATMLQEIASTVSALDVVQAQLTIEKTT